MVKRETCVVCSRKLRQTPKTKTERLFCSIHCSIQNKTIIEHNKCWLWNGSLDADGYALVKFNGKMFRVSRVLTKARNGKVVLHSCDNPGCVNPKHLTVGTVFDNNMDKWAKGRCKHGVEVRGSKLANNDVLTIFHSTLSAKTLAETFGVSNVTIFNIKKGRTHSWLTGMEYNRKSRSKQWR